MTITLATGGAEYPLLAPRLRPLTDAQARTAVREHVAALLRVLVDLPPDQLGLLGDQLLDAAGRMAGTAAEPFRPAYQMVGLVAGVVHAHPAAGAGVADQLDHREA